MKKAIILLSAIMSVMTLTVMADEYTDPQTNVVYTYEPGQPTASVKAGCEMVVDMGLIDLCPGSPDAAGDVVILDKFTVGTTEYVVTSIGEQAFWTNNNIKSVSIPESVTDIGVAAFEYCDGLTAVQLPEGLIRISRKLFHNCSQLESVVIPSSIRSIDEQAFADCRSLASLTLPANLSYIGRYAFQNTPWYSTQYNEAPDGLFYIGPLLVGYKGNVPTGDLVIKEGTTCIGYQAFNYCTGLTSVTIPESLTHVDYRAFYNCVGLTAVHITNMAAWCKIEFQWDEASSSSNPLFYAHHLYLNGEEMTDLVIPDGVTSICRYAFDNCTGLTSVIIPEGVTRISSEAFRNCGNLTSVTIPPSMTTIGSMAFIWCFNLNAVHISDLAAWCGISFQDVSGVFNYDVHLYLNDEEVKDLVIPEGVVGISKRAFLNCRHLTSVTIPRSVTNIGDNAFYGCSNLTDVYSYGNNVPSLGYDVFKNSLIASATLHVPAGSIEEYKTTSPWSGFGNIVALPTSDIFIQDIAWVDGFGYEVGGYKIDDVKLFYYTTAGDTLINDKNYFRILRTRKCKTTYKLEEDAEGNEYVADKELITQDDTLCFFMREDEEGNVWFYTEDKNVFYEISHNTLYEYLADNLVRRDLFLYNAKKKYTLGDNIPLGMSVLFSFDGIVEGDDYWKISSSEVCKMDEMTLLDGKTYMYYDAWFLEKLGPLFGGPLFGFGQPNSYNLDFKQLFAFYKDGQLIYRNEGYLSALEEYFPNILDAVIGKSSDIIDEPVSFTEGQMATIILPEEPDASKGKYYRLDRVEDKQIIFEQELHPQAHVPYIIVPSEDFAIDLNTLDLEGCSPDTVSIKVRFEGQTESQSIYFIGSYVNEELEQQEGCNIQLIDTTPDCSISFSEETGKGAFLIGALRAYLTWDDPYNQGGTKGRGDMEIVLRDYGTGIKTIEHSTLNIDHSVFDLSGKKIVNGQLQRGIYIENGQKKIAK